jgi:hypothetical protein
VHPNVTDQHIHQKGAWILSLAFLPFGINANIVSAQTATQRQALKKCGVGLVLPSWLPPGFKMATFNLKDCSESRFPGYEMTYKGPSQCEFSLYGQNGGWGAPGPVRQWQVKTKLFGTVVLEEWEGRLSGNDNNYLNAAATNTPYFKSYPKTGYVYSFSCKNKLFNINDAKRILQSSAQVP